MAGVGYVIALPGDASYVLHPHLYSEIRTPSEKSMKDVFGHGIFCNLGIPWLSRMHGVCCSLLCVYGSLKGFLGLMQDGQ